MNEYVDPIEDDPNARQAEIDQQRFIDLATQYADFKAKYPDLYAWLYAMADNDEREATEKLIQNISNESNTEQRMKIQCCRYYKQWLNEGEFAVAAMRTQTEPN